MRARALACGILALAGLQAGCTLPSNWALSADAAGSEQSVDGVTADTATDGPTDMGTGDAGDVSDVPAVDVLAIDAPEASPPDAMDVGADAVDVAAATDAADVTAAMDAVEVGADAVDVAVDRADVPADAGAGGCTTAPRLIAPLSGQRITSTAQRFRWTAVPCATGYTLKLCASRDCTTVMFMATVSGTEAAVPAGAITAPGLYYWRVRADGADGTGAPSPQWTVLVRGVTSGYAGAGNGQRLDVDGDGLSDLVYSDPRNAPTASRVWVSLGAELNRATPSASLIPPALLGTDPPDSALGFGVAAGDWDGDGTIEALAVSERGRLHAIPGSRAPLSRTTSVAVQLRSEGASASGGQFGNNGLMPVGDVDGDGYLDVVITDQTQQSAWLHRGGPGGVEPASAQRIQGGGGFGYAPAGGDFDGDGYADLLVTELNASRVILYRGGRLRRSSSGADVYLEERLRRDGMGYRFGWSTINAGDLNADGFPDMATGILDGDAAGGMGGAGGFRVFYGAPTANVFDEGLRTAVDGAMPRTQLGRLLVAPGDVTGDGVDDLVAFSNFEARIYRGRSGGLESMPTPDTVGVTSTSGPVELSRALVRTAVGGDFDGNGLGDLAVVLEPNALVANCAVYGCVAVLMTERVTGGTVRPFVHRHTVQGVADMGQPGYVASAGAGGN